MKVAHAYPGMSPHALEVSRALFEEGVLDHFYTTVGMVPGGFLDRYALPILRLYSPLLAEYLERSSRPRELCQFARYFPYWDLARQFARRYVSRSAEDACWELGVRAYDRWVSKHLHAELDAVVGYEHSCRVTFSIAQKRGISTIYHGLAPRVNEFDVAIALGELTHDAYLTRTKNREPIRRRHKAEEYKAADYAIANSSLTASSMVTFGFPPERIAILPLGAPPPNDAWKGVQREAGLKFLYAGRMSTRKGIHLLMSSWREASLRDAELWLAGSWGITPLPEWRTLPGVKELGQLDRDTLYRKYLEADVLVFPTLSDGFGMVVTEALAHGMPVITTDQAGAADLIEDGVNGWVIPANNTEKLVEILQRCASEPDKVRAMRPAAMESARKRPWSVYRKEFVETVRRLIGKE